MSTDSTETRRYSDRSRAIAYQTCPRRRFLGFEWQGRGLAPVRENIPLLLGSEVHTGAALLMTGTALEAAIDIAKRAYMDTVREFGLDLEENEDAAYVAYEQAALLEAHLRLFHLRSLPALHEEYEILEVEKEDVAQLPGTDIWWMSRCDALLLDKATQTDLYIYSLKTQAIWDKRSDDVNRHDMQGVSEAYGVEQRLKELHIQYNRGLVAPIGGRLASLLCGASQAPQIAGIKMEFLLKGRRIESPEDSGRYIQTSPLIRGYRKRGITTAQDQYAWKWEWRDELGNKHRLGKGWEKFDAFDRQEMGVAGWIEMLNSGNVQPEAGDALESQRLTLVPYYRQEDDAKDWLEQITRQEAIVSASAKSIQFEQSRGGELTLWLNCLFPQHKRSCDYPTTCPFNRVGKIPGICYNPAVAADPIGSGLYKIRTAHHAAEAEALAFEE